MTPDTRLTTIGEPLSENTPYRQLVGKLLYLTTTRPDISFAVQQLSQFLDKPTISHMKAIGRVLRYLKGAPGQGLLFPADSPTQLRACALVWDGHLCAF